MTQELTQVTLTIKLDKVLNEPHVSVVEAYFRGQINALEGCAALNCDRRDWDRMIAAVVSVVVRNYYPGNGEGDYGSVKVTPNPQNPNIGRIQTRGQQVSTFDAIAQIEHDEAVRRRRALSRPPFPGTQETP